MFDPVVMLNNLLDKLPAAQTSIATDAASSWLLDLYFCNNNDHDINEAIALMEDARPGSETNIQFVMMHALLHNRSPEPFVVKMLWHYLMTGDRQRLDDLREHLKAQLQATESRDSINLKTHDAHSLAVLICVTDGLGATVLDYSLSLSRILLRKPDHPQALEGIALIQRLNGDEFNRVSDAYIRDHLDQGFDLAVKDTQALALINTLYPSPKALMIYAATALYHTMQGLPSEPRLRDQASYLKDFNEQIDTSMAWIKQALNPDTEKDILSELHHLFYKIMEDDWRKEDNADLIRQILNHLCDHLDSLQVPWKVSLEWALCQWHRGVRDPVYAAGLSLLKPSKYLVMQALSQKILGELSTEDLAEKFAHKKTVLAAIYKLTGNAELVAYMDNKSKHDSISHDLGI